MAYLTLKAELTVCNAHQLLSQYQYSMYFVKLWIRPEEFLNLNAKILLPSVPFQILPHS